MARARGSNAKLAFAFESAYGTPPGSGFFSVPFVSSNLGPERGLIEDDLLGNGREKYDPVQDVVVNDGNVVVPVDLRYFGHWLRLLMGSAATTGSEAPYIHTFTSGAQALPSAAIETQLPDVPSFEMNYGNRVNSIQISMQRSGLLNATVEMVGKGANARAAASTAGSLANVLGLKRFRQATGRIKRNDSVLGSITRAQFTMSNQLDKVETIQPDGEIEDADPGQFMVSGSITARYDSTTLHDDAIDGTPVDLEFDWVISAEETLVVTMPRVFLPVVKTPVEGPGGVLAAADFMGSGQTAPAVTAVLTNDVAAYA